MNPTSVIELSRSALKKNVRYLQKRIGDGVFFCSVIKGNAYGHGIEQYVPLAEECGIRLFAVFDAQEAWRVWKVKSPQSKIIVMGMIDDEQLLWAIAHNIEFFVFDIVRLKRVLQIVKNSSQKALIHLELETGLNRTGFCESELETVMGLVKKSKNGIAIQGICTHYAGAESFSNHNRIENQYRKFMETVERLQNCGMPADNLHTACSAAALTYPKTIMNMVRFGIAQYGFWPSKETRIHNLLSPENQFRVDPLQRVLSWKTQVMSVKTVLPGEFIGYGACYLAEKTERIAIIPVGYSHGYSRSLSNLGHVLIRGCKAPIVGTINMNMLLANVTNIPKVQYGEEVVLIGKQKKQSISVASFSELAHHVNYEMLTRLPSNIQRVIVD